MREGPPWWPFLQILNKEGTTVKLPDDVEFAIFEHTEMRNWVRQELNFRKLSGRRYNKAVLDMTDEELQEQLDFSTRKINELLAPYEKD